MYRGKISVLFQRTNPESIKVVRTSKRPLRPTPGSKPNPARVIDSDFRLGEIGGVKVVADYNDLGTRSVTLLQ